jgi:virulence-associated protein VagC
MKTYSNRSNALRAAKTAGYQPDQVEIAPQGTGFIYQPISGAEPKADPEAATSSAKVDNPKPPVNPKRKSPAAKQKKPIRRSNARAAKATKKVAGTKAKSAKAKADKAQSTKGTGKGDLVVGMLKKGKGASVPALLKATGWQAHSLRAFISVQAKKQRWKLKRERKDGVTVYRIAG